MTAGMTKSFWIVSSVSLPSPKPDLILPAFLQCLQVENNEQISKFSRKNYQSPGERSNTTETP